MMPAKTPKSTRVSGTIKSTDARARTFTLETGRIYHSEAKMDLGNFKSGDRVDLTCTETDGEMRSSDVTLKR